MARAFKCAYEPLSTQGSNSTSRRLARRLTPEMVREIVHLYKAGEPTTKLGQGFGISRSSLASLLREEGVRLRGQAMTREATDLTASLYSQGRTIRMLAEQVGYSYGTVRAALHRDGLKIRRGYSKRGQDPSQSFSRELGD